MSRAPAEPGALFLFYETGAWPRHITRQILIECNARHVTTRNGQSVRLSPGSAKQSIEPHSKIGLLRRKRSL